LFAPGGGGQPDEAVVEDGWPPEPGPFEDTGDAGVGEVAGTFGRAGGNGERGEVAGTGRRRRG
jgi:hypothetical protein